MLLSELVWILANCVGTKFHLKQTISSFWTKRGVFPVTFIMDSAYLNKSIYQISSLTDNFELWDQICPKKDLNLEPLSS